MARPIEVPVSLIPSGECGYAHYYRASDGWHGEWIRLTPAVFEGQSHAEHARTIRRLAGHGDGPNFEARCPCGPLFQDARGQVDG